MPNNHIRRRKRNAVCRTLRLNDEDLKIPFLKVSNVLGSRSVCDIAMDACDFGSVFREKIDKMIDTASESCKDDELLSSGLFKDLEDIVIPCLGVKTYRCTGLILHNTSGDLEKFHHLHRSIRRCDEALLVLDDELLLHLVVDHPLLSGKRHDLRIVHALRNVQTLVSLEPYRWLKDPVNGLHRVRLGDPDVLPDLLLHRVLELLVVSRQVWVPRA